MRLNNGEHYVIHYRVQSAKILVRHSNSRRNVYIRLNIGFLINLAHIDHSVAQIDCTMAEITV